MLGIELPIIQGGMQHLGVPELASVVSNAGGAGTINRTCYKDNDAFREGLRQMNEMTNKPYFVNISLLPGVNVGDDVLETIRICGEMGVKAIETAGSRLGQLVPLIHEQGMLHFQKVPGARYAKSAERAGVDAVNVVGFECAGHPSMKAIGSVVCTRKAAKICSIPVIAGGGYADGYGMAGAIAMGAEGVIMGTRFVATQECTIHPNFKEWIVNATEDDTLLCQKSIKNMVRVANNDCAKECLQM